MLNWLGRFLRAAPAGAPPQDQANALVREALAHGEAGRGDEAERLLYRALALAPASAGIHNNLGNVLRGAGKLEGAIAAYRAALALAPGLAEAHFNLGLALLRGGDAAAAAQCFRAALEARPEFADARLNLGFLLEEEGDSAGAIDAYRGAAALDPQAVEPRVNLGMQLLLEGRYAEGWKEYEWRLRYPEYGGADLAARAKRWDGSGLGGRAILLDAEQGYGDAIQFLRYASLVAGRGGHVIVRCAPELAALAATAPGVSDVVLRGAPLPPFDVHCPLPSLPLVFGTTLETIPARVPYLHADPAKLAHWKARLAGAGDGWRVGLRVGLVWASQSKHRTAAAKSMSLGALAPLAGIPGLRFYSLQKGEAAREAGHPPAGLRIEDLDGELRDFSDTAAAAANLDLVISVDTAVAHLAGALGRPAWTLLRQAPDWRWLRARADSPWYPTMRLLRQKTAADWRPVVDELAAALRRFAAGREAR